MSSWSPSYAQFTVLRARNLISKGKGGNNDVFVTIQLGKEKYQTSTIKNARNPEWFEECDLPIPHLHSEIEVAVYHRGMLSDDFLGYAAIPLWEQKLQDAPKTQWIPLKCKPGKADNSKYRGEVEVKVTFHCHSRVEFSASLKKRSSSIRNLATAVGDKFKFSRSKSLRENRKDPEGGKPDRNQNHTTVHDATERKMFGRSSSSATGSRGTSTYAAVSFPALDLDHMWSGDAVEQENLTRSYSMSAAYIKSMTLDRGRTMQYPTSGEHINEDLRSQSLYNIAGNRHSMVELPSTQPPPPYHPSSQDDMTLVQRPASASARPLSHQPYPTTSAPYLDSSIHFRRDLHQGRYESIREKTEPESSSSDETEQVLRRPRPPPRGLRSKARPLSADVSLDAKDLAALSFLPHKTVGSSLQTTVPTGGQQGASEPRRGERAAQAAELQRPETITNGTLQMGLTGSLHRHVGSGTANGDVKMRKRSKRDRLIMYRQGTRRFTFQGSDTRGLGLFDDSLSDPSDSSRTELPDDLFSGYKNMSKEELLHVVIQNKAQIIRKDQYIKDLESYIDNLLVRVMETQPRILNRPTLH